MKTLIRTATVRRPSRRRLDDMLDSNFIPSFEEERALRESLNQICNNILTIKNQIAEGGAILANLEARRETRFLPLSFTEIKTRVLLLNLKRRCKVIISERQTHLAVLSPIRRLPLETIGLIFEYALPETVDRGARYAALQLYTVCHRWRDAAFVTHSLWSRLFIAKYDFIGYSRGSFSSRETETFKENVSKGICEWIRRSGSLPLTIHISNRGSYNQISGKIMESLPEKHRWKDVVIHQYYPPDFPFTDVSLNSLESIHLEMSGGLGGNAALNNAPNLKKVRIDFDDRFYIRHADIPNVKALVPWMQLLELEIGGRTLTKNIAVSILSECRDLQICKINAQGDRPFHSNLHTEFPLLPPTHLPRLHSLHIENNTQLRPLLLSLNLPNLDDLFIKAPETICRDINFTSAISEFVQMSGCLIRKLEIQEFNEDDERMCGFLVQMTSLVELRITSKCLYGYCFCKPVVVDALQNLEVLEITSSGSQDEYKYETIFLNGFISLRYGNHEAIKLKQVKLNTKDLLSQHFLSQPTGI